MRRSPPSRYFSKLASAVFSVSAGLYRYARQKLGRPAPPELYYVIPDHQWVTDWIGRYVTENIARQFDWRTHLTSFPNWLSGQLLHYGEVGAYLHSLGAYRNARNFVVVSIFHAERSGRFPELTAATERFLENASQPGRILTACSQMRERLVSWGIAAEKVTCIPLGVDLQQFQPVSMSQRLEFRRRKGIPDDAICIGSFQKDGEGWGEGLAPKLIKGPDIFLQVVERLRAHYKLFVLLSAPARGFVKRGLEALGVPYRHELLSNYLDIANLYHCLDIYLMASREEGGPQAILESLATGVPLVATRTGLAPDVIQSRRNGLLADPEDVDGLSEGVAGLIEQTEERQQLISNGLEDIKAYDWPKIAARYYHEVYAPVLWEECPAGATDG